MDFNELLPIGSVVILKNAVKKLMIFGVGQTESEENKEYDYIGVMYPEGNMGDGSQYLFNHSDIDKIYFRGYEDEERNKFIELLQNFYDESQNSDEN
jgi:hypothetical protein